jgi:alkyl hydroperoxide reductase subunit AhpC
MKKLLFFALSISLSSWSILAQNTTAKGLEGLHIAGPNEIKPGTPLMLNPAEMPIYNENFERLTEQAFQQMMMSMEYMPEPYLDDASNVKALVLRRATPEELKMIQQIQANGGPDMGGPTEIADSPLLNLPAPPFEVKDLKANSLKLEDLKGKVVVLNFWFVECKPCVSEIPELNELVMEFQKKGVVFMALGLNNTEQMKKFLKKTPFNYQVVPDAKEVANQFGVDGFPTSVVIDQEGVIRYISLGVGPQNKEKLAEAIRSLII